MKEKDEVKKDAEIPENASEQKAGTNPLYHQSNQGNKTNEMKRIDEMGKIIIAPTDLNSEPTKGTVTCPVGRTTTG